MSSKTVYILGAGFSMNAGAPSQASIVEEIFNLKSQYKGASKSKVIEWVDEFNLFLTKTLCVSEVEKLHYALEDIYTPIDRSITEAISFREHTPEKLIELRDHFNKLIILAIRNTIERNNKSKKTIEKFANHIISLSKARLKNEKTDLVSVITTNWDIMLDNIVNRVVRNESHPKTVKFSGVVDYCCYMSSLDEDDDKVKPGLYAIGKGRYNVKILKLHGSLNWLQCPKCQRLYVKYYQKWNGGYVFKRFYCRHCERNNNQSTDKSNVLATNLIMPTFLKNLNNVQNKLSWQNVGVELAEASKIVFLGYSLPQADYEFKQLLSRMVRSNAVIEVVLIQNDNPEKYIDNMKYQTAGYRFQNFFSGRKLNISYDGVQSYIDNLI